MLACSQSHSRIAYRELASWRPWAKVGVHRTCVAGCSCITCHSAILKGQPRPQIPWRLTAQPLPAANATITRGHARLQQYIVKALGTRLLMRKSLTDTLAAVYLQFFPHTLMTSVCTQISLARHVRSRKGP
jgi:hypothetical protein